VRLTLTYWLADGPRSVTQRLRGRVGCITDGLGAHEPTRECHAEGELIPPRWTFRPGVDWPFADANDADVGAFDAMGFSSLWQLAWRLPRGRGLFRSGAGWCPCPTEWSVLRVGGWIDQLAVAAVGALAGSAGAQEILILEPDIMAWLAAAAAVQALRQMALSWIHWVISWLAARGQGVWYSGPAAALKPFSCRALSWKRARRCCNCVGAVDPLWAMGGLDRPATWCLWRICTRPLPAAVG